MSCVSLMILPLASFLDAYWMNKANITTHLLPLEHIASGLSALFSNSPQRRQDNLRRQWNLSNNGAEWPQRVIHRIGHRCRGPRGAGLARALGAEFGLPRRRYHVADIDIGHLAGHRHQVIGHVGVSELTTLVIDAFLEQRR